MSSSSLLRALLLCIVALWGLGALYLSFAYLGLLGWAWPNFNRTPFWTQGLAWTVVAAPAVGLTLAAVLAVTGRARAGTAVVAGLAVQLMAVVTLALVS